MIWLAVYAWKARDRSRKRVRKAAKLSSEKGLEEAGMGLGHFSYFSYQDKI